jgi:hypothetical protein
MTMSTTANWLANFAVGKFTPSILRADTFNLWGTFLFFGAWCAVMVFFTLLYVPETAGVPLEDMSAVFDKSNSRSLVYRCVLDFDFIAAYVRIKALSRGSLCITSHSLTHCGSYPSTRHGSCQ